MIRDFQIERLVPRFILQDRNGNALARAIEAGLRRFLAIAQAALDTWGTPEKMPEWRLDELAWEYDIVYDATADLETKRGWIKDAIAFYSIYGTPEGLRRYLEASFSAAQLQEWWAYGGDPCHFRVNIAGQSSTDNLRLAQQAIAAVKNVRSVLDGIYFRGDSGVAVARVVSGTAATIRASGGYARNYKQDGDA